MAHLTRVEQSWGSAPLGCRVALRRGDVYDRETGLFHSPAEYVYEEVGTHSFEVSDDSIASGIVRLVHPGLSDDDMPSQAPEIALDRKRLTISEDVIRQMLRTCEARLVFGGTVDDILAVYRDDRAEQIRALLSHPLVGNRKNRDSLSHDLVAHVVWDCLRQRLPFQLVLPAFPFKDQNPFRNPSSPSHWDIGEASLLIRLHCIALGLNQLHPFDGEWVVVSDGRSYAPIFGIRDSEAVEYLAGVRELRNSLNLQNTVHFLDLRSIMEKVDRCFNAKVGGATISGLRAIISLVEDRLEAISRSNNDVATALNALAMSMVWNLNTRDYLNRRGHRELWRAMNSKCRRLEPTAADLRRELLAAGWRAGLRYASLTLTLATAQFWSVTFPHSLRATVHAKEGQAVIPKLGRGDPWNAVGVFEDARLGPDSIRTLPLWKLRRSDYQAVYLTDSPDPIGFVRRKLVGQLVVK